MASIRMAVGDRLETQHLLSGRVQVEGFDIDFHNPGPAPAPIFNDMVNSMPYDVGELTIANYIIAKDQGVPLIGLPVFPNLFFPLSGVTVNVNAGISKPGDLAGKRVGVPLGFASNPAVWLRGILAEHFRVPAEGITWIEGEADSLRGVDYPRPAKFRTEKREKLSDLVASGEIDALVVAGGNAGTSESVRLLSEDPLSLFRSYIDATGTFPINTLLVMKEEAVRTNPGLAGAVVAASDAARAIYDAEESDDGIHQGLRVGDLREMGLFPRAHGLATHGSSIESLVRYLGEQELITKAWKLSDLFV